MVRRGRRFRVRQRAVGPDGALYVSNKSTSIGTGEVLRIEP
jgi:hypothetical protein